MSDVFSIASQASLQYLLVVMQEHTGCSHFFPSLAIHSSSNFYFVSRTKPKLSDRAFAPDEVRTDQSQAEDRHDMDQAHRYMKSDET
jgi:hypothetical protein